MKRLLIAVFPTIFLISCAEAPDPVYSLLNQTGEVVGQTRAGTILPEHPSDCSVQLSNGVSAGEPLHVALRRVDARLDAQNARIDRCADWYAQLRAAVSKASEDHD